MLNHNTISSIVMLINRSDNQINDKEITKRPDSVVSRNNISGSNIITLKQKRIKRFLVVPLELHYLTKTLSANLMVIGIIDHDPRRRNSNICVNAFSLHLNFCLLSPCPKYQECANSPPTKAIVNRRELYLNPWPK